MRLTRIEGPACILVCSPCGREGIGGTEAYFSASSGEARTPEDWYLHPDGISFCSSCAFKVVQKDPTRSRHTFYTDTGGTQIDPEVLTAPSF